MLLTLGRGLVSVDSDTHTNALLVCAVLLHAMLGLHTRACSFLLCLLQVLLAGSDSFTIIGTPILK